MNILNIRWLIILLVLFTMVNTSALCQPDSLLDAARNKPVTVSSYSSDFPATMAVNGVISRNNKWMTQSDALPPHYLVVDLQHYYRIGEIVLHTGIPEHQLLNEEKLQASGFWSAKHFKLQYWDDANWTDIPKTEITENRKTTVRIDLKTSVLTFKLRLVVFDGEPVSIMGLEAYGSRVPEMIVPEINDAESDLASVGVNFSGSPFSIKVLNDTIGRSMQFVGYNQAYYLPGSNVSGWLEYSGVNSLRIWASLGTFAPPAYFQNDSSINSLQQFEQHKALLRADPEHAESINWEALRAVYATADMSSTNSMVLDYVLEESKRLGIALLMQMNERYFEDSWSHKWLQWQRFYAFAYYVALHGDVTMFAIQNEPNHAHSGPMDIETWLRGMRIASDAVRCALQDVNQKYGKALEPIFVGPVTAGTNTDWWAGVAANVRTDYRGVDIDYDLIDLFSTHSYNSPAPGYKGRVEFISEVIRSNHPLGHDIPVIFTEIGRWMNAYLIDKAETMDSPSLFTEWAGIYTNNMLGGSKGMWAFKFAHNTSPAYPRGIKSGHHYTWNGKRILEDTYVDIALNKQVSASCSQDEASLQKLTQGDPQKDNILRFEDECPEKWVMIDLQGHYSIGSAMIYSGSAYGVFTGPDRLRNFSLQYHSNGLWVDIPKAQISNSRYTQVLIEFDQPVVTDRVRLVIQDGSEIKLRAMRFFEDGKGPENAPESYDISGAHRTAEVVRLFAKGFSGSKPLFKTAFSQSMPDLDFAASKDVASGNYYLWLVNRSHQDVIAAIELLMPDLVAGHPFFVQSVCSENHGNVSAHGVLSDLGIEELPVKGKSVTLVTIAAGSSASNQKWLPSFDAMVAGGANSDNEFAEMPILQVSLNEAHKEHNQVAYIHFDSLKTESVDGSSFLMAINGSVNESDKKMLIHMYGYNTDDILQPLTWNNAPHLHNDEALVENVGREVDFIGQVAFNSNSMYHYIDITSFVKKHRGGPFTLIFVRETRHIGDYANKELTLHLMGRLSAQPPMIIKL